MAAKAVVKQHVSGSVDYFLDQGLVLAGNAGTAKITKSAIRLKSPDDKSITATAIGSNFSEKGDTLGGTITGLKFYQDGKLALELSGLSIKLADMGDALDKIERQDNWSAFEKIFDAYFYAYNGSSGSDEVYFSGRNDNANGRGGDDFLSGGRGDDVLKGAGGGDMLDGGAGDDSLIGGAGDDFMVGGAGKDKFNGGGGEDRIVYLEESGSRGVTVNLAKGFAIDTFGARDSIAKVEEITGTRKADKILGDAGDNYFVDTRGGDFYDGRGGTFDQIAYHLHSGSKGVKVDLAKGVAFDTYGTKDTLKGMEVVRGSMRNDEILGDKKANVLRGLDGKDVLDGRGGIDQVRYDIDARYGGGDGVTVRLDKGWAIDGFGDRDKLSGIENVRGSDSDDVIVGNRKKNVIEGRDGDDVMTGKGGKDVFLFRDVNNGADVITDFQRGADKIDLEIGVSKFRQLDIDYHDEGATVAFKAFEVEVQGAFDKLSADDFLF